MRDDLPAVSQINWLPVYNDSGETIPAFAAMRISGIVASTLEFKVAKPNSNNAVNNILFNGPVEIPAASFGIGTADTPAGVRYDTADGTPSNGDEWGVSSADWKLRNARNGFLIQGVIDSSVGIATAARAAFSSSKIDDWWNDIGGDHTLLDGDKHTDTLAGTVVLGDVIHGNATPKWARLAGPTAALMYVLTETGTGSAGAVPVWKTLAELAAAGPGLYWIQTTIGYATVKVQGTDTYTFYTLPNRGIVHGCILIPTANWDDGGGVNPCSQGVGFVGTPGDIMTGQVVGPNPPANSFYQDWVGTGNDPEMPSITSSTGITIQTTHSDYTTLTSGTTVVHLLISILPA